jgi:PKD repeat protein
MLKALRTGLTLVTALALSACTVHQTEPPPLTGPSESALAVRVTATPDSLALDGGSQSAVVVEARDAKGAPRSGLPVRLDIAVGSVFEDCGQLSARNIVTGSDGRATSIFTAPAMPLPLPQCQGFSPGNTVTITATPSGNNFQTATQQTATIRLVPLGIILPGAGTPAPCITMSPAAPAANIPVQFTAGTLLSGVCGPASPDIVAFAWSFGDGGAASGRTVTHTFTTSNTYSLTLTETNDRGVSASTTQVIVVGPAALPTPSFTVSPSAPGVGDMVFFNASTSTPGQGHSTITSYRWTFGDGLTGSGVTVSHAYAVAGSYVVQLTVTDETGQSNTSAGTTITIGSPPAPTAIFTFTPQSPAANQAVTFDASTSTPAQGPGGQPIVSYSWTFGDNTAPQTTSSPIISHTFGFSGIFNVNLVVRDSAGRTGSRANQITIAGVVPCADPTLPCATITATPSPASVNTEVSFVAVVTSFGTGATTIVNYQWDFGDGTQQFSTSVANVGYTYRRTGTFQVKLTLTNNVGKSASATLTVLVQ